MQEISRERLQLAPGEQAYIQPVTVVADRQGRVLLAGERNYVFRSQADGHWALAKRDSILGVVLNGKETPHVLPSPIPTRQLAAVRATTRPEGGWHVVFAETRPYEGPTHPDSAQQLWYAEYVDSQWTRLERIPLPPGSAVNVNLASQLLEKAGALHWALAIRTADQRRDVVVLSRVGGTWTYEIAPTFLVNYLDLAYSARMGLVLAIVQPDLSQRADGNSLFLWSHDQTWKVFKKLISGTAEQVHHLQFAADGAAVSWEAIRGNPSFTSPEAHALLDPGFTSELQAVRLDPSLGQGGISAPLQMNGGGRMWILHHVAAVQDRGTLRFVSVTSRQPLVLGEIPNPFDASFGAAITTDGQLLLTGAQIDSRQGTVTSLLIRFQLVCGRPLRQ